MKVEDLKNLSSKVVSYAQNQKTEQKFHQFLNLIKQSLQGNRQQQQPVAPQKDQLLTALRSFDEISLSYSEMNLFHVLSYDSFVGSKAAAEIDTILYDDKFDPVGVHQKIEKKFNELKQFLERSQVLLSALQPIPNLKDSALKSGEAILEITFIDKAAIDNIIDFEGWLDSWTKIIRAFSQLVGEKPESSRIVFVQKSSPLIIDIATACALVIALGKAVDAVLDKVEKYLRIKRQVEEIHKLKLENKKIEKDLLAEAEAFSEKSAQEIAHKLTAKLKSKDSGEIVNGISLAVKSLFVFIDKGGRVDCPSTNDGNKTDGSTDLFKQIRHLQRSVDQLRLLPMSFDLKDNDSNN